MIGGACAGTGLLAEKLHDIINRTAKENATHSFVPHVTVAGPIQNKTGEEVLKALQDVAATLPVRSSPPPVCPLALLWSDSSTPYREALAQAGVLASTKSLLMLSSTCGAESAVRRHEHWHLGILSLGAQPRHVT